MTAEAVAAAVAAAEEATDPATGGGAAASGGGGAAARSSQLPQAADERPDPPQDDIIQHEDSPAVGMVGANVERQIDAVVNSAGGMIRTILDGASNAELLHVLSRRSEGGASRGQLPHAADSY